MSSKIDVKLRDAIDIASNWLDYISYIKRIPCVSFGIIQGESLVYTKDFGYMNIEKKSVPSNNTAYRIASISKLFTTIAILQLVEKEKLCLDDRVSKHLNWFSSDRDKNLSDITIRHLLFHCSGLTREADSNYWINDKFPDAAQIKTYISKKSTVYASLENWKYSNLGFGILGLIIEKISGKKYTDYVTENIIKKLHMTHTEPDLTNNAINYLATGYSMDIPNQARKPFNHVKTKNLAPATGFLSTVEDLSKFLVALFNDNNILSSLSKKEMRRIQWEKDQTIKWGLGVQITKLKDTTIYGHSGGFQGYITSIGYSPDKKLGIIVLTNCIDGQAQLLMNSLFNMIITVMNNYDSYKSDKKINLDKYTGRFGSRWGNFDIRKINGKLIMFSSNYLDPFYGVDVLEYKKDNTFIIKTGDGFGNMGEDVHFLFTGNKVKKVIVGYSENEPVHIKR
jgi:D-alanyl-D-alanine carboxypeptidase